MLRITIHDEADRLTMELEGRFAGPWVEEVERAWKSLNGCRRLCIDIRKVAFADARGRDLLRRIHQESKAGFLADTPLTEMYVEEASRPSAKNETGGKDDARS